MRHPAIETERLKLRGFSLSDAVEVKDLAGAREVACNTLLIPHPYEDGFAERWIAERQVDFQKGGSLTFAMVFKASNRLCGAIGMGLTRSHAHAEIGYWVGVAYWNRGYCSEAARSVVDYGFEVLKLNRIWAAHFRQNPASGRVLEKIGMTHEGCLRRHILKWGEYLDVEQYGILRGEWEAARQVKNDLSR